MNIKRFLRITFVLFLMGLFVIGLTSCKLPASKGLATDTTTSDGFPLPNGTAQAPSGNNVSTFATQTAQANPPVVIITSAPPQNSPESPIPTATEVPVVPVGPTDTAAPIVYVTATPGGPPATYTLQEGEFSFCIARRFDVNLAELLSLNGLDASSLLQPGDVLQIPQTGNGFGGERALHEHPSTYQIDPGDTLNRIACYYGDVSPDMIALQNSLTTTDLPVGEVLIIP